MQDLSGLLVGPEAASATHTVIGVGVLAFEYTNQGKQNTAIKMIFKHLNAKHDSNIWKSDQYQLNFNPSRNKGFCH